MSDIYPRDMVGYGRNPPHPKWPNGARIAVQFVINYEEGAENNILHGDAGSEWTHPGKVEAPYTVCIASASNLTGLVKSSVECRRTGL